MGPIGAACAGDLRQFLHGAVLRRHALGADRPGLPAFPSDLCRLRTATERYSSCVHATYADRCRPIARWYVRVVCRELRYALRGVALPKPAPRLGDRARVEAWIVVPARGDRVPPGRAVEVSVGEAEGERRIAQRTGGPPIPPLRYVDGGCQTKRPRFLDWR